MSIVAVVTDVVRDGRPVVGYGFHSAGRYAQQGILRERLIPRLLEGAGGGPARRRRRERRPLQGLVGDDGEREAGRPRASARSRWPRWTWRFWDLAAKIEDKAALSAARRPLRRRRDRRSCPSTPPAATTTRART